MKVHTFKWTQESLWSPALRPVETGEQLVLAFGGREAMCRPALDQLKQAFPAAAIWGCSTSGEILGTEITDDTVVVAVVSFERIRLRTASAEVSAATASEVTGETLSRQLVDDDLRAVLVLSDGLAVNGSDLVNGLRKSLPEGTVVTGGLAGDGSRFEQTWVLVDGTPRAGMATAVGLYGKELALGYGSRGGWDAFGPERVVTRSEGNVLFELDGEPALDLYKKYLGERAAELPASALLFPLAIRPDDAGQARLVRTVLSVDEASRSMTFAGDIPAGYRAQLMRANFERLVAGAEEAANLLRERACFGDETLAIAISCVGRRLVLGERAEEEIEATLDVLPEGTHQIGFYSYGEISPSGVSGCDLHNQTMTLTTISEV